MISILWALEQVLSPLLIKGMIDIIVRGHNNHILHACAPYFYAYLATSTLNNLSMRAHNELTRRYLPRMRCTITTALYQHTLDCPSHIIQTVKTNCLSKKTQDVTQQIEKIFSIVTDFIMPRLCTLLGANWMLYHSLSATFCTILSTWTCLFLISSMIGAQYLKQKTHAVTQSHDQLYQGMADTLNHHRLIENHHHREQELERMTLDHHDLTQNEKKLMRTKTGIYFLQSASITCLMGYLLYTLMHTAPSGTVTAGQLTLMLSLANAFVSATYHINHSALQLSQAIDVCLHTLRIFPPYLKDIGGTFPSLTHHRLNIDSLNFGHSNAPILFNNIHLEIPSGHKIGIQGPSGSGKSTLAQLIAGKKTPLSGKVTLQGHDLTSIPKEKLAQLITFLDKKPDILNRSIVDNLRMAKPSATASEIMRACQLAKCDTFIEKLEQQYTTLIGRDGLTLSAGQAQRLALARVFLNPSPIIILDEATCHLDSVNEEDVLTNLITQHPRSTLIMISHHLCPQLVINDLWTLSANAQQPISLIRGMQPALSFSC